ncbi:MAG: aminotransferase class I/II-fold pyridoxal phosphate-dependent enzyme, partial [Methanothrix sp.]|nr:aminotransferase class I/II-fold pyridoxal phosphate-dependent enzyme [Methanothrix sp.]
MNFDTVVDRSGTGSLKWERVRNEAGKKDVVPLWVADMDFPPPEAVVAALRTRIEHPIYGYTDAPREYFEVLSTWYRTRHGAEVGTEAILTGPGLIPTLGIAVRTLTAVGDGVLVMPPVYGPFFEIVRDNDRIVVEAPLRHEKDGAYTMDLGNAARAITEAAARGVRTKA